MVSVSVLGKIENLLAEDDFVAVNENGSINFNPWENDIVVEQDNDTVESLELTLLSSPSSGLVEINPDGSFFFDTNGDFDFLSLGDTAEVKFTYGISLLDSNSNQNGATNNNSSDDGDDDDDDGDDDDGDQQFGDGDDGDQQLATVTVNVSGLNDAPVAIEDTGQTTKNSLLTIDVLDNDIEVDQNDDLSLDSVDIVSVTGLSASLSTANVTIVDNQLVFDPRTDFEELGPGESAIVTVNYTISDELGESSSSQATITVTGSGEAPVGGSSLDFALTFETSNQSIWSSGSAFQFQDSRFLGGSWNESGSITLIPSIDFLIAKSPPVGASASTSGKVGLDSNLTIESGLIDVSLPFDLEFDVPSQVEEGQEINIGSSFSLDPNAFYEIISPSIAYQLDLVYALAANLSLTAGTSSASLFNLNIPENRVNLVDFDSSINPVFEFGTPIPGLESFTLKAPNLDVASSDVDVSGLSLSSQTRDDIFTANLDLDAMITGLIPGFPALEGDITIPLGPIFVKAGYNIADFSLFPALSLEQDLKFATDGLTGMLIVEDNLVDPIQFSVGEDISFVVPEGVGTTLDLEVKLDVSNPLLENNTSLGLDVDFVLDVLSASLGATFLDIFDLGSVSFGPLLSAPIDIYSGKIADVFNQQFALGGFNQESVSFGIDVSA